MYSVVPNAGDDPECGWPVFKQADNAAHISPSIPLKMYFFDVWLPLKIYSQFLSLIPFLTASCHGRQNVRSLPSLLLFTGRSTRIRIRQLNLVADLMLEKDAFGACQNQVQEVQELTSSSAMMKLILRWGAISVRDLRHSEIVIELVV